MSYRSTDDSAFQRTVAQWIENSGEILMMIRYSRSAGATDYEFFTAFDLWQQRLRQFVPETCVTIWGMPLLPLRGHVDDAFIERALGHIDDGAGCLIVALERVTYGLASWFENSWVDSHADLEHELKEYAGTPVAVGLAPPWPPWIARVKEVSAVVPHADGRVIAGIY